MMMWWCRTREKEKEEEEIFPILSDE